MAEPHESLVKLMVVGNRDVGKSSLMRKFSPCGSHTELLKPYGIEYTARTIQLDNELVKLQIWNAAVQERFRTIPKTFYQGAKGLLLVYDVTNQLSFTEISKWLRNIKEDPANNIKKILVGNKADKDESERAVSTGRGQALAKEYDIEFFETSAETNMNVEEVFFSIARDIMLESKASGVAHEPQTFGINLLNKGETALGNKLQRSQTFG
ncbi:putative small GTPase superfamily, P-loop containing nucleoside triphosphate hydrolase [Rosa chinensis]|uniref:Putative small GTPase superfamily, P-loop containing nucleoside triphosphate hydrolase n=1 Tax=Rosa chinensis TaxID=74649 RepID=A0A2P6PUL9_ROSCH|nr:ras-related protein RABE1c [Rosa chinensis]PRQ25622.1 putative small GTPase superfamily, P-loop containing nucleoside triphosphate hydrolase [Rosa chinensis]